MARKTGSKTPDDECSSQAGLSADLESPVGFSSGESENEFARDMGRMMDLEPEEQSPFLRSQKRVAVRRGPLPKKAANRLKIVLGCAALAGAIAVLVLSLTAYGRNSWRFRIDSSDLVQVSGNRNVTRAQIVDLFGGDISRDIFLVPLEERKRQLEQVPWIQAASVERLLPNRISVEVHERTPIAFARVDSRVMLVDASGVLMEMPASPQAHYSFPVIEGLSEAEPPSTRAARMRIYQSLMRDLDGSGAHYSQDVSDVDIGDPEDVKVTVADPDGELVVHLGAGNFLDRYKIYISHIQEWRQEHAKLQSVDLRYDHQIVLNPDLVTAEQGSVQPAVQPATATSHSGIPAQVRKTAAADKKAGKKQLKQARAEAQKKQQANKLKAQSRSAATAKVVANHAPQGAKGQSGDGKITSASRTTALVTNKASLGSTTSTVAKSGTVSAVHGAGKPSAGTTKPASSAEPKPAAATLQAE